MLRFEEPNAPSQGYSKKESRCQAKSIVSVKGELG